jgi:hypothetical protein
MTNTIMNLSYNATSQLILIKNVATGSPAKKPLKRILPIGRGRGDG